MKQYNPLYYVILSTQGQSEYTVKYRPIQSLTLILLNEFHI